MEKNQIEMIGYMQNYIASASEAFIEGYNQGISNLISLYSNEPQFSIQAYIYLREHNVSENVSEHKIIEKLKLTEGQTQTARQSWHYYEEDMKEQRVEDDTIFHEIEYQSLKNQLLFPYINIPISSLLEAMVAPMNPSIDYHDCDKEWCLKGEEDGKKDGFRIGHYIASKYQWNQIRHQIFSPLLKSDS